MKFIKTFIIALFCSYSSLFFLARAEDNGNKLTKLTIEKIMRDPQWIGHSPSRVFWSEDSKYIYFRWNPENAPHDSLYVISRHGGAPRKVTIEERKRLPSLRGDYNRDRSQKVYEKNGDIFLLHIKSGVIRQITNTLEKESNPRFSFDEQKIIFTRENNLFSWTLKNGLTKQLSDFRSGEKKQKKNQPKSKQEKWLQQEELKLIATLKKRKKIKELSQKAKKALAPKRPKIIYLGNSNVQNIQLSPDEQYITFTLYKRARGVKRTIVPNYVTESGFTEDLTARPKVGVAQGNYQFKIYDIRNDTVYSVDIKKIPGIFDRPEYLRDKVAKPEDKGGNNKNNEKEKLTPRKVYFSGPLWSNDGKQALLVARSLDHKDRWMMLLDVTSGEIEPLERTHDKAWIGGPGSWGWRIEDVLGWLPDNQHLWFQSEADGYAHLYLLDVRSGEKKQLTKGKFEIYSPKISRHKKYWYFTANKTHPGERHFYRMNLDGSHWVQITNQTGANRVYLSPDEKTLAVLYSYTNKPWELFVMKNQQGARAKQITTSVSHEFLSYPWRDPEVITFTARDSAKVYARLYRPQNPQPNSPAVIFVHGAGYLQNAHKWWSSYFREYMFNNMLADHGYYVLDIDYRGSAGYGRDWRTAIYRHMGGKDLADQVDGATFLVENYHVDPHRIGLYGGSYGGFITLMAMFTEPDVFTAGAALRPVTDWAHYNHGYTSNILNIPYADSLAYVRSSPIYYAEGLKGALLICHGMIDVNVHFQDVVRLTQRLIELGKENWEVAIYPLEGHGFREPSSWTDEYKRIFKLFENNLKK